MLGRVNKFLWWKIAANVGCFLAVLIGLIGAGFASGGLVRKFGGSYAAKCVKIILAAEMTTVFGGIFGLVAICRKSVGLTKVTVGTLVLSFLVSIVAIVVAETELRAMVKSVTFDLKMLLDHYGQRVLRVKNYSG